MMPALNITPSQFGVAVSAYAFSAGGAGLLAAGFADKFDRKKMLLFFYFGFVLGTLLCGVATTYHFLLFARIVTGIFGGVLGSIVFAITTDLFPFSMRGRVIGFVQTAFAASQVLGIPVGLFLSNHWGWQAPFLMIVLVSVLVGAVIVLYLKPIDQHLKMYPDKSAFHHLFIALSTPRYLFAFAATALLSLGGFMIMPFSSAFTVHNVGVSLDNLPLIYLISGGCSIFIGPLVGRASDRFGKFPTFAFGSVFGAIMAVVYTNLGVTPLHTVILVNVLMFVGIFSRMIPSQALMSAVPGLVVVQKPDGFIEHFDVVGYILAG
jgi:predicted MFS family arabinose efflux permease